MTQAEAAKLLRVHPRTLRRAVESDGFPEPVKLCGRVAYVTREVIAYVRRKLGERSAMRGV